MKVKKILAGVLAGAMTLGMMSVAAMATDMTTSMEHGAVDNGAVLFNLAEAGFTADQVNGATVTITMSVSDAEAGFGGGVMMNASSGWKQSEAMYWGNEGQANNTVDNGDGTYSLTITLPEDYAVTDEDLSGEENTWCSLAIQQWWGNVGADVTSVAFGVTSTPVTPDDDSAAGDDGSADNDDATTDDSAADDATDNKTGDASFLWIALAALAATVVGTTVVLSKKSAEEM